MRALLQAANERIATEVLRFLQIEEESSPVDVARQPFFFLSTIKDESIPILFGQLTMINDIGLTISIQDRSGGYFQFIPWEAVHDFKVSFGEFLQSQN